MKRCFGFLLCLLIIVLCAVAAADIVSSGKCGKKVSWTLDDQGVLTISGTGKMYFWDGEYEEGFGWDRSQVRKVVIREGVTVVGSAAFENCPHLESISIPASVTKFGKSGNVHYSVTYGCSSLKAFNVASGNKKYCSKDGVLFSKNMKILYSCPQAKAGKYTVPANVKEIYGAADVTSGGLRAFDGCVRLTEIVLPEGVETMEGAAICGNTSLKCITLPASLKRIGWGMFGNCSNLTDIYYTGTRAQWKKLQVDETVESWFFNAAVHFGNTEVLIKRNGLTYCIHLKQKSAAVAEPDNDFPNKVIIPSTVRYNGKKYKVTEIEANAFLNQGSLTSVTIGENVNRIGNYAFSDCCKLKSVKVLTTKLQQSTIGSGCFKGVHRKVTFKVPQSLLKKYQVWFVIIGEAPEKSKFTESSR